MEVEHFVGIGIALIISLILMWVVWSYFCQDKSDQDEEEQSESGETESFSSTYVITATHKKVPRRTRNASLSSCNDATTEEESEGGEKSRRKKPRRKSKKSRTASYLYQKNNYGLDDPFAEWKPSQKEHDDHSKSPQVVYPKSPVLKHHGFKKDRTVVDM